MFGGTQNKSCSIFIAFPVQTSLSFPTGALMSAVRIVASVLGWLSSMVYGLSKGVSFLCCDDMSVVARAVIVL